MSKQVKEYEQNYTTIKHNPRIKFGLSNNDYCIANAIYHLQNKPDSRFAGWYYGKAESLSKLFNFSRSATYNSLKKLQEKNLIERNTETGFLRTTKLWWDEFINDKITSKEVF
jgi:predicted transcriptional regulator